MIDGHGRLRRIPAVVLEGDATLADTYDGSICVHAGVYTIAEGATHFGAIVLQAGSRLVVHGKQTGSVQIHEDALMEIHGEHAGDLRVLRGGSVWIASGGCYTGQGQIRGRLENAGTRAASVTIHEDGVLVDLAGSYVAGPDSHGGGSSLVVDYIRTRP